MKKQLILMLVICLVIPLVNAESFGTYAQNSNVTLIFSCQNSTFLNISKIFITPSNVVILNEETQTTKSSNVYNYTVQSSNTTNLGDYYVYYHCDINGIDTPSASYFTINNSGYDLSTSESLIMMLGFIGLLILSGTFFIFGGLIQHTGSRVFLYSMSVVLTVFSMGYGYSMSKILIGKYSLLVESFGSLYNILIYLLIAGGFGIIMFLIAYAFDAFYRHRGLKL